MERTLWTNGVWGKRLVWLATTMAKVDLHIHTMGVQAMEHARIHGDVGRMVQLVQALGQTTRRKGFLVWVEAYSPIRMKADGTEGRLQKRDVKGYVEFDVDTADKRPFWTLEAADERTAKPLSVEAFIGMLNGYGTKIGKAEKGELPNYELQGDTAILKQAVNAALLAAQTIKAAQPIAPAPVLLIPAASQPVIVSDTLEQVIRDDNEEPVELERTGTNG